MQRPYRVIIFVMWFIDLKIAIKELSLEQYIAILMEEEIVDNSNKYLLKESDINEQDSGQPAISINEWENQLLKFINSPLNSNLPPLSDEAISRENIYTGEDEILCI